MPDITMCKNDQCPLKEKCYRFTAEPSNIQEYFAEHPSKVIHGKFQCDMFMGESADYLLEELKSIFKNGK